VDVELWIAGEGELRGSIKRQIRDLRLRDRVRLLGQMQHDALLSLYRYSQVDVVVLPSIDLGNGQHEGIPVALMEAMAYAIPVVATETGGIPELVGGGAGLLIQPANPQALAGALTKLAGDAALRRSLGLGGRKRVEQSFEITKMVRELVRRFDESASTYGTGQAHEAAVIDGIAPYPHPGPN
jgi:colanic acid/amylovoran biosynthesis glycosyltransferase